MTMPEYLLIRWLKEGVMMETYYDRKVTLLVVAWDRLSIGAKDRSE